MHAHHIPLDLPAAKRLAGMGEIGSQLVGVAPNDPELAPYVALVEEFDVPVLIHTEGIATSSFDPVG